MVSIRQSNLIDLKDFSLALSNIDESCDLQEVMETMISDDKNIFPLTCNYNSNNNNNNNSNSVNSVNNNSLVFGNKASIQSLSNDDVAIENVNNNIIHNKKGSDGEKAQKELNARKYKSLTGCIKLGKSGCDAQLIDTNYTKEKKVKDEDGQLKKNRRSRKDLNRDIICDFPGCNRAYASKHAARLHFRLKHTSGRRFMKQPSSGKQPQLRKSISPETKMLSTLPKDNSSYIYNNNSNSIRRQSLPNNLNRINSDILNSINLDSLSTSSFNFIPPTNLNNNNNNCNSSIRSNSAPFLSTLVPNSPPLAINNDNVLINCTSENSSGAQSLTSSPIHIFKQSTTTIPNQFLDNRSLSDFNYSPVMGSNSNSNNLVGNSILFSTSNPFFQDNIVRSQSMSSANISNARSSENLEIDLMSFLTQSIKAEQAII